MMRLVGPLIAIIISQIFDRTNLQLAGVTEKVSINIKRIAFGLAFILLGIIAFGVGLLFGGFLLLSFLADLETFIQPALWTTLSLLLIGLAFFWGGSNYFKKPLA